MQRTADSLTKLIHQHLHRRSLRPETPPWDIRKSSLGGFGVFATRNIEIGEIVFRDLPLVSGPRAGSASPLICANCLHSKEVKRCKRGCGLRLCSEECQDTGLHQRECKIIRQWRADEIPEELYIKLMKVLTPIRSLLLSEEDKEVVRCLKSHKSNQHGFEVDIMKELLHFNIKEDEEAFMRLVCSVMDANAFEVLVGDEDTQSSVRGLYPLGGLANHSCTPNTIHVFDQNQIMIVLASNFIPKDQEIFHSYSRLIWGTSTRRYHLFRTKHFICKCERCEDPTEFKTYLNAILCKICKTGNVIPLNPLVNKDKWQCETCGELVSKEDVAALTSLLGSALNSFERDDVAFMLRFIEQKLLKIVSGNHESIVEMKYKLIWILGYHTGFTWIELTDELLKIKEKFCNDLLDLLIRLKLGQCKMRGLLLYEFYCTCREINRRNEKIGNVTKVCENLLLEAADILKYDVSAPEEIKNLW